jgi:hypothetical protein
MDVLRPCEATGGGAQPLTVVGKATEMPAEGCSVTSVPT